MKLIHDLDLKISFTHIMSNQDIVKKIKGFSNCKHILKTGKNKGMLCGRGYCLAHFNVADFLDLPLMFRNIVENNKTKFDKFFYKEIRDIFYKSQFIDGDNEETLKKYLVCILNNASDEKDRNIKYVLYILLYKLLDISTVNNFIKNPRHSRVLETCNNKIIQFINEIDSFDIKTETDLEFKKYLLENLQVNRKYFFKYKNLRFSFMKLKISIIIKLQLHNLYSKTLENMYKPEGTYIPVIRQHFEESCQNL